MTIVYNLWYRHGDRIGGAHTLLPGTYSTETKAQEARTFLSDKEGFVDYGIEGFAIQACRVDVTLTPQGAVGDEGMLPGKELYELWHRRDDGRGYDHDTLIGLYSSQEKAKQGISLVRDLPEFSDLPDAFETAKITVDRTHWEEGFFTAYPGEG